ncbi:GVQW3-like protein [Mya arenaria]|uniref:GVQW3-like protein n=1 Tax=Mya arenaria TaxID=6604 RepID=A0ABY7DYV9_MYAAR|nr:GVQW3-like protein [Mya arenaria]
MTKQRAITKLCLAIGKTPSQTRTMLEEAELKPEVCRALVFKWHKRFSDGRTSVEDDSRRGRKKKITENLISKVCDVIEYDRRQNVAKISQQVCVSVGTKHTVFTKHLNMQRVSARWIPRLWSEEEKKPKKNAGHTREEDDFINRIVTTDENLAVSFWSRNQTNKHRHGNGYHRRLC